jgi:hypothetical protein
VDWERRRLLRGAYFFTRSIPATVGVIGLEKAGPKQADNLMVLGIGAWRKQQVFGKSSWGLWPTIHGKFLESLIIYVCLFNCFQVGFSKANWRHILGNGVVKTCGIRNLVCLVRLRMQYGFEPSSTRKGPNSQWSGV